MSGQHTHHARTYANDIVRCVLINDTRQGRQRHYTCPDAALGDIVQATYDSPARVVGFGRNSGYAGVCRTAEIIDRSGGLRFGKDALYNTHLKAHKEFVAMNAQTNVVEQLTDQLKAAKKAEKRAAKIARERKAVVAEKLRLRQAAIDTLENVAEHGTDEGARIAAAVALLDRA